MAKMMNSPMESFFENTRQNFSVFECFIGSKDCRADWSVVGTLYGMCLTYNPKGVLTEIANISIFFHTQFIWRHLRPDFEKCKFDGRYFF